jgi:hypothetical protein
MPRRLSKQRRLPDPAEAAFVAVQRLAGETSTTAAPQTITVDSGKNPAAVALGLLGGSKGGKARAKSLTKKERSEIARKAAVARWGTEHRGKKETKSKARKHTAAGV